MGLRNKISSNPVQEFQAFFREGAHSTVSAEVDSSKSAYPPNYVKDEVLAQIEGSIVFHDLCDGSTLETLDSQQDCTPAFRSNAERIQYRCMFVLIGSSCLFFWNSVLNVLYSVVVYEFAEDPGLGDTITSVYSTMAFITAMVMAGVGGHRIWLNVVGGLMLAAMSICFPLICNYASNTTVGVILLHMVAVGGGAAEMLFQCSGYAYAVILPESMAGWVSFGYGVCGFVSFLWWMLVSKVICDTSVTGTQDSLWWQFGLCAGVNLIAVVCFLLLARQPLMASCAQAANKKLQDRYRERRIDTGDGDLKQRGLTMVEPSLGDHEVMLDPAEVTDSRWQHYKGLALEYLRIFLKTWKMQLGMAFLMFLTNMCFPNIGPYSWEIASVTHVDTLTGIEQIGDFMSRYIPNLASLLSANMLLIPQNILTWLNLGRILLFIVWLLIHYFPHASVLGDFWFQVVMLILMSVSNGWFATCFMIYIPSGVEDVGDKSRASSMGCSLLVLAIAIGEWMAKIWSD